MAGQTQPSAFTNLVKQGAFDADVENALNNTLGNLRSTVAANATDAVSLSATGTQTLASALLALLPVAPTQYTGSTDAILFPAAVNFAQITSASDACTLATPAAGDAGKLLLIVNSSADANTVTTSSGKILDSSATAKDTATATAHAGSAILLFAISGFWVLIAESGFALTAV